MSQPHDEQTPRSVLVIGGTGGVGEGIARALLENGSFERVLVSSRSGARLEKLRERAGANPRLITILGGVDDVDAARELLTEVRTHGDLGAVVASLGGWWENAPLPEIAVAEWHAALAALLTPHLIAARTFVPALEVPNARYLLVGGGAATTPVPGSTLVSIAGAAQLMLARSLVAERPDRIFPIIEELVIDGPVDTGATHHGPITEGEITPREIGDVVARMLRDGTTGAWPNATREGPIVTIRSVCSR